MGYKWSELMIARTQRFEQTSHHWLWSFGALGLAALLYHNWRLWQQDKANLNRRNITAALPALETWPTQPKVSVLVAAWNETTNIDRHIQSFMQLRYPNKELILCAGGNDGTYQRVLRWSGNQVKVLEQAPREGKQHALRRCLRHSDGAIIFLTDADCVLSDEAFERTLYPVICETELACSGTYQPYPEQVSNPFVTSQAASQIYSAMHNSRYAAGLSGANCAIERSLLERSGGLDAPAATGTDYVLAKMLTSTGAQIRQEPRSLVATEYPESASSYIRQQRRWLRNVVLHGWRFGANAEVRACLHTSATGLAMLILPLSALFVGAPSLVVWLLLYTHALLSRIRYLRFANVAIGTPFGIKQMAIQAPMLLLDFAAWSRPLLDFLSAAGRNTW
jgi:cellulose synthase/poly-beta-1,6-N-acetylglucosamine synthase-like glycosyltransferase